MRTYRLSATLRSPFHEDGKEDQLDELHLDIQVKTLVSGYASEPANISARWPVSSAKALSALQRP